MKELPRKADFLKILSACDSESTGGVIHAFKKQSGCSYQEKRRITRGEETELTIQLMHTESGRKNCRHTSW